LNSPFSHNVKDITENGAPDANKEKLPPCSKSFFGSQKAKDDPCHKSQKPYEVIKNAHIEQFTKSPRPKAIGSLKKHKKYTRSGRSPFIPEGCSP
jgi:hypothetical protein